MALDYIIQWSCPIREELDERNVFRVSKIRDHLAHMEQHKEELLAENPGKTLEELTITIIHPERGETTRTVAETRAEWRKYEEMGNTHCPRCPANYRQRALGCFGAVTYPLTARFEEWLVGHFEPMKEFPDPISCAIERGGITGAESDERRGYERSEYPIFEASAPRVKSIPHSESPVSTTQILNFLMRAGSIRPDVSWALLTAFGAVSAEPAEIEEISRMLLVGDAGPDADEGESPFIQFDPYSRMVKNKEGGITFVSSTDLPIILESAEVRERLEALLAKLRFVMTGEESDDRCITGFKYFLYANYVALRKLVPIWANG